MTMSGGRYANYAPLESFQQSFEPPGGAAQQPQQPQYTIQTNDPCMQAYNPAVAPGAPPPPGMSAVYNPTAVSTGRPHHQSNQQQQQQQHHNLLVSVSTSTTTGYAPNQQQQNSTMTAIFGLPPSPVPGVSGIGSPLQMAQQQPPPPQLPTIDPNNVPAAVSTETLQLSSPFDPLPFGGGPTPSTSASSNRPADPLHREPSPNLDDLLLLSSYMDPLSSLNSSSSPTPVPPPVPVDDEWLDELKIKVSALSLEPMTARQVVSRIRGKLDDVVTLYLPCVDFLVQCQQDLRKGLAIATQKRMHGRGRHFRNAMSPHQFYAAYIEQLPHRFYLKNQHTMDRTCLNNASQGLNKLVKDAKDAIGHGCEAVKSSFLGGMKDGESWGLRKWLSRNGNGLRICTDLECVLNSCQKLDRDASATKKLADILRPISKQSLDKLKQDVPSSYQEHSTAHPYLPFYHRLESALRGMSNFDPDDDDVICIDDDDDIKPKPKPVSVVSSFTTAVRQPAPVRAAPARAAAKPKKRRKRKKAAVADTYDLYNGVNIQQQQQQQPFKRSNVNVAPSAQPPPPQPAVVTNNNNSSHHQQQQHQAAAAVGGNYSSSGESDNESVIEIIGIKPTAGGPAVPKAADDDWICANCSMLNVVNATSCLACGEENLNANVAGAVTGNQDSNDFGDFSSQFDESLFAGAFGGSSDFGDNLSEVAAANETEITTQFAAAPIAAVAKPVWPLAGTGSNIGARAAALAMANNLDQLAVMFDQNQQAMVRPHTVHLAVHNNTFWDGEQYACSLRLLSRLLRDPHGSSHFLDSVNEDQIIKAGNYPLYSHVIKHPLCFRDIVSALVQNAETDNAATNNNLVRGNHGRLPCQGLSNWNMWRGIDLLQAIDLVFLNSLAYGKAVDCGENYKSQHRSQTNKLRKSFWDGINGIVVRHVGRHDTERRKQFTPTRRSESSGFVVYKIQER